MEQQPQPAMGDVAGGSQVYPASAYAPTATVAPGVTPAGSQPTPLPANPAQLSAQNQLLYEQSKQYQQQLQQEHQRQLQQFWAERLSEIEQTTDFKNHALPLARIKKIMKADEDVRMISAEAPMIFAKACEMFILELTLRSWMHTEENKRRTLQKNDISAAITRTDIYDFLVDIIPRDEMKEEGVGVRAGQPAPVDTSQYYYAQQAQQQMPGAEMVYCGQQGQPTTYLYQEPQEQQQGPPSEHQSFNESG
jgi:nuclear transcription factor Y gamma